MKNVALRFVAAYNTAINRSKRGEGKCSVGSFSSL